MPVYIFGLLPAIYLLLLACIGFVVGIVFLFQIFSNGSPVLTGVTISFGLIILSLCGIAGFNALLSICFNENSKRTNMGLALGTIASLSGYAIMLNFLTMRNSEIHWGIHYFYLSPVVYSAFHVICKSEIYCKKTFK